MSKETYHVNEERSNSTWQVFFASILCCLSIVLLLLCLKFYAFDGHAKDYDSICEFVTFGPVKQPNLKGSKQWIKIENDIKSLCNIRDDVQIYSIGSSPVPSPVLKNELLVNLADNEMIRSEEQTSDNERSNGLIEPQQEPSILISGQDVSNSLLMSIELQFDDELWAIIWEKAVDTKMWQIEAQNIDAFNVQPPILLYEIVKRVLLQLLFSITIDECYQASLYQAQVNCTNTNFMPSMQADIVRPLVNSFMANETKCVQSEFFIKNFETVEMSENFEEILLKRAKLSNIINFEVKLCH